MKIKAKSQSKQLEKRLKRNNDILKNHKNRVSKFVKDREFEELMNSKKSINLIIKSYKNCSKSSYSFSLIYNQ